MKKALVLYFFALSFLSVRIFGQTGGFASTLDEAITESMSYFSAKLPAGMKVVVLNVESPNENLSSYIIDECGAFITNDTELSLVDKSGLSIITQERNIKDMNEIDEPLALEIGKELDASGVIMGSVSKMDGNYRFRVQALDTQNGRILGILSITVKEDEILTDLLEAGAPKSVLKDSNTGDTDSIFSALQLELRKTQEQLSELKKSQEQLTRERLEAEAAAARESRQSQEEAKKVESGYFVFSISPEFVQGSAVMGAGGSVELGVIGKNNFYFTGELNGGGIYYGGGVNIGGCFNKDGNVKNVLGISAGYRNTLYFIDFTKNGEILTTQTGNNISAGGGFYKLMFGKANNFDVTNKLLFGFRKNPVSYKQSNGEITYEEGFNMTYVLGVGYTLTKSKK